MSKNIKAETLKKFIIDLLVKNNVPDSDASLVADTLLKAELWNIKSHGLSRLKRYIMRLNNNTINAVPEIKFNTNYTSAVSVDGDNGLGCIVMNKALDFAINIAQKKGICAVGVKNSNHFGITGYYCDRAAQKGLVAIGFSNSLAAMAPWGGKSTVLGTNPIAFGFPQDNKNPVIIDMATSAVARGKVLLAEKENRDIPAGWAMDKNGNGTTNATEAANGLLMPMAGVKGYALSLAVDVLAGVFTGALFGSEVGAYKNGRKNAGIGHMFILLRKDCFINDDEYAKNIAALCKEIHSASKAANVDKIFLPGEREFIKEKEQLDTGIDVSDETFEELLWLAEKYAIHML